MDNKLVRANIFSKNNLMKFLRVNIGTILVAVSLHFFTAPAHLSVGGASGFSLLLSTVTGIPMSLIYLIVNLILVVLGIVTIGMSFGALTIYSSIIGALFLGVLEKVFPMNAAFIDDLLIILIFGILIQSLGIAMVLNAGASTGGSDIIGKIIEKYTSLSFGNGLIICDGLITIGACVIFGPRLGMYGLLGVMINSHFIDRFIAGFNSKYNVTIISKEHEAINNFILVSVHRGSTVYEATGGFSHNTKKIITTIVDRREYIKIHKFVKNIDPVAFLFVSNVSEIEGEGFTYSKN
ncbi:MAG: YitT family protein [Peptostreptococcaceae bacterium]|nr:YitT family protein [uncultured Criibacterium sp.]MBS6063294.1 YitT family protein [Peptostreptococcaceae bacterium]